MQAQEDYMHGQTAVVIKLLYYYTAYIIDGKYVMTDQK